jgi:hypothetical protein
MSLTRLLDRSEVTGNFAKRVRFKTGLEDAGLVMELFTRRCNILQGTAGAALIVNSMRAVQPLKEYAAEKDQEPQTVQVHNNLTGTNSSGVPHASRC